MKKFLIFIIFVVLAVNVLAAVDSQLPIGLQKIAAYNQSQAALFVEKITIFVAFLAGLLSFLAPCTLAIVPAYFAATFRERKKALPMTLAFFLGFSTTFIGLGLVASAIGQTFATLQLKYSYLVIIAGIALIVLGFMSIFNRGFTFIKPSMKISKSFAGVFLTGIFFAFGWSACVGPILSGVLLIASLVSYSKAALLMFFYALGNFVPFIVLSSLIDKYNILGSKWISGKEFKLNLLGKEHSFHTTTLISGLILVALGLLFLIFGNTSIINLFDPFNIKFSEEGWQRGLLSSSHALAIALLVIILASVIVWYSLRGKNEKV